MFHYQKCSPRYGNTLTSADNVTMTYMAVHVSTMHNRPVYSQVSADDYFTAITDITAWVVTVQI